MPTFYVNSRKRWGKIVTVREFSDRPSAAKLAEQLDLTADRFTSFYVSTRACRDWYESKNARKNLNEFNRQILQLLARIAVQPEFTQWNHLDSEWFTYSDRYGWLRISVSDSEYLCLHCSFEDTNQSLPATANGRSGKYNYSFDRDTSNNFDYVNGCVAHVVQDLKSNATLNAIAARMPTAGEIAAFVTAKDIEGKKFGQAMDELVGKR